MVEVEVGAIIWPSFDCETAATVEADVGCMIWPSADCETAAAATVAKAQARATFLMEGMFGVVVMLAGKMWRDWIWTMRRRRASGLMDDGRDTSQNECD